MSNDATVQRRRLRRRIGVVCIVLIGAVTYLLVEGLGSSLNYFDTVPQALHHKKSLGTQVFRLEGVVSQKSVHHTKTGASFTVSGNGYRVHVINQGNPPGLFQAGIPVVVVGHFKAVTSSEFLSNQIMVKHSATYIAAHPTRVRAKNGTTH